MNGTIPNPLSWQFLNEPLWQWFVFFVAMSLFAGAWAMVLHHMKAV